MGSPYKLFLFLITAFCFRYVNHSARFIAMYREGLSGSQAVWVNKRYYGHQMLPPEMVAAVKNSILDTP